MGEIRSALDIALEKTANIQGDKTSAERRDLKNAGKKAAGDFLSSGDAETLNAVMAGKSDEQKKMILGGAVAVLLAGIRIPSTEEDIAKVSKTGQALETLLPKAGMQELFGQVEKIFAQYLSERDQLSRALEQQMMPRLRAKQQEMYKRYGQNVPIDPAKDPEFAAALSKNMRMLEQKYGTVVDEVRARIRETAGIEE
jgi:hypothetical protein